MLGPLALSVDVQIAVHPWRAFLYRSVYQNYNEYFLMCTWNHAKENPEMNQLYLVATTQGLCTLTNIKEIVEKLMK